MDSINDACKFGSDALLELQAFKTRQLNRREKLNRHKNLNQDVISDNIRSLLLDPKTDDLLPIGDNEHYLSDRDLGSVPINSVRLTNKTATSSSSLIDPVRTKDECNSEILNQRASKSNELSISSSRSSTNQGGSIKRRREVNDKDDLESLLSLSSTRERENKKLGQELLELLSKPTAKERNLLERFRSADGYRVQEFCPKGTKGECRRNSNHGEVCDKLHFKKIIAKHTEESLGDCSFLNTCFRMDSCKYVHYEVDYDDEQQQQQRLGNQFKNPNLAESNINKPFHQESTSSTNVNQNDLSLSTNNTDHDNNNNTNRSLTKSLTSLPNFNGPANVVGTSSLTATDSAKYYLSPEEQAQIDAKNRKRFKTVLYPPQWIQCDLRFFDMSLLGKFSVVMADPPWDIHMELPYGTMSDDEMRKLNVPALQDEGVIFLWVTGRAMELGRECLALWGYERCDEIIWVKTNQLQRIIRTGRTGHWLNHGKEHCLVGVKGQPKDINRGLDCDVIVAEVRATSHKPDEIYGIIERLSPGTRKIELFGRAHNVQPNWITLGNQLNGVKLVDPMLVNSFKKLNLPFQTAD